MASVPFHELLKPEVWTSLVDLHTKEYQTPLRALTRDINEFSASLSYGASVPLPYSDEIEVRERGELGSVISFPFPEGQKDVLFIDKNKIATTLIPDEIKSNLTMPYINEKTQKMAQAQINAYEKDILSEIKENAKMTLEVSKIDSESIKNVCLGAIELMNENSVPMQDRFIVLDHKSYTKVLDWLSTLNFTSSEQLLKTGIVGDLYGLSIAVSSLSDGIYFGHKNSVIRADSYIGTEIDHDITRSATLISAQMVYGIKALREGEWLGKVLTK